MTDYIPTTEEVKTGYIYYRNDMEYETDKNSQAQFNRWLDQHDQAKELEVGEKVARWIEDSIIDFNTYNAYEVRNICAFIARGDSK